MLSGAAGKSGFSLSAPQLLASRPASALVKPTNGTERFSAAGACSPRITLLSSNQLTTAGLYFVERMSKTVDEVSRARPDAALFAVYVLTDRGQFEVTHTADPAQALRLAADEHWDLVLTDIEMPGMTGLELLDALRQVAPTLPVALVTAHATTAGMGAAALLGGAYQCLEKAARDRSAHFGRDRPDQPGTRRQA